MNTLLRVISPTPQHLMPLSIGSTNFIDPTIGLDDYCIASTPGVANSSNMTLRIPALFASGTDSTDPTTPPPAGGSDGIGGAGNSGSGGSGKRVLLHGLRVSLHKLMEHDQESLLGHLGRQIDFAELWRNVAGQNLDAGDLKLAHRALVDIYTIIYSLKVILDTKVLTGEADAVRKTVADVNSKTGAYRDLVEGLKKDYPKYFDAANEMETSRENIIQKLAGYISAQAQDIWRSREMLTAVGNGEAIRSDEVLLLRPERGSDEDDSVDKGGEGDKVDRTGGGGWEDVDGTGDTGGGGGWENPDGVADPLGITRGFMDDIRTAFLSNDIGTIRGKSDAIVNLLSRVEIEERSFMIRDCMRHLLELEGPGK